VGRGAAAIFHDCQLASNGAHIHATLDELLTLAPAWQERILLAHYADDWPDWLGRTGVLRFARRARRTGSEGAGWDAGRLGGLTLHASRFSIHDSREVRVKVLGMSASVREWGNTDLLVRHALAGATAKGAETRFLRVTELELKPCRGCMSCVFKDRDCVVPDRLSEVLEALRWADAVVIGSPAYVLGATGALKNLQDRLIRFGIQREFAGKPGLAVVAAGVPGWAPFSLPQVSLSFLFLGMPLVDQFVGFGQGPGEILFDEARWGVRGRRRDAGGGRSRVPGRPGRLSVLPLRPRGFSAGRWRLLPLCDLTGRWGEAGGRPMLVPDPGLSLVGARPR